MRVINVFFQVTSLSSTTAFAELYYSTHIYLLFHFGVLNDLLKYFSCKFISYPQSGEGKNQKLNDIYSFFR